MQRRQNALRGEVSVGYESDEERRDHARQRGGSEDCSGLRTCEPEGLRQVGPDSYVPGSPDYVIEKHHDAEPQSYGKPHTGSVTVQLWTAWRTQLLPPDLRT